MNKRRYVTPEARAVPSDMTQVIAATVNGMDTGGNDPGSGGYGDDDDAGVKGEIAMVNLWDEEW